MNSTQIQRHKARRLTILTLLAMGDGPKQIAKQLGTSEDSIRQTMAKMRAQAECQTTTELVYKNADLIRKVMADMARQGGQAA